MTTATVTELAAWFQRTTGKPLKQADMTCYRITIVEHLLDRADWTDQALTLHLTARYSQPEQVAQIIKQHAELTAFLPPDAVPSPDEENEYEALAYELYAAIKKLVSSR